MERVATNGSTFDTDEFLSLCGLSDEAAYDCLDAGLAVLVIERALGGYRFRHPLTRDALLEAIPPHRRRGAAPGLRRAPHRSRRLTGAYRTLSARRR